MPFGGIHDGSYQIYFSLLPSPAQFTQSTILFRMVQTLIVRRATVEYLIASRTIIRLLPQGMSRSLINKKTGRTLEEAKKRQSRWRRRDGRIQYRDY